MGFTEFIALFAKEGPLWALVAAFVFAGFYLEKEQLSRDKESRADLKEFNNRMLEHLDALNKLVFTLNGTLQTVASSIALQEREFEKIEVIVLDIRELLLKEHDAQERSIALRNTPGS
jgi:hypothetical protein